MHYYYIIPTRGGLEDTVRGVKATVLLAASASISWVFAKSIQNASILSATYGIVGGVAVRILAVYLLTIQAAQFIMMLNFRCAAVCWILHSICFHSYCHLPSKDSQGLQVFT